MQLILKEDVASLGKAGEIVKVREGYGRNFLLPQKKAILANPGNLKEIEAHKRAIESKTLKDLKKAREIAQRLNTLEITISRKVGSQDRLFGSVTNMDIALALRSQGIQIDKHLISIEAPIKAIGSYQASIRLHPEVKAELKLWVVREGS